MRMHELEAKPAKPAKPAKGRRIVCLTSLMDSHKSDGLKPYE